MSKYLSKTVKAAVAQRAYECCEYCFSQQKYVPDPFAIEHIIPKSKGGKNLSENWAFACQGCNNRKYNHTTAIDPVTGKKVKLYHPRKDNWNSHFKWNKDYMLLIGLSPTGRATIEKLKLNRLSVINLRKVMSKVGKHPPEVFSR